MKNKKSNKTKKILIKGIKNTNLKKKLGEVCVYCGCNNKLLLNVDHKIPLSKGGKDIETNKQITCAFCNYLKWDLLEKEFKEYLKSLYNLYDLRKLIIKVNQFNIRFSHNRFPLELKDVQINKSKKRKGVK